MAARAAGGHRYSGGSCGSIRRERRCATPAGPSTCRWPSSPGSAAFLLGQIAVRRRRRRLGGRGRRRRRHPDPVRRRRGDVGRLPRRDVGWRRAARAAVTSSRTTPCASAPSTSSACRSGCSPSSSLVPLVYVPLRGAVAGHVLRRPVVGERREAGRPGERSRRCVLLVLMVCVGAPIVEELVYRGLLQGSFAARFNHVAAWLAASAWFALIHFRPVEYPGLFVVRPRRRRLPAGHPPPRHVDGDPRRVQRDRVCCSRCGDRRIRLAGCHHCRSR